jgi:putative endonuclease
MANYYTYILISEKDQKRYIGSTSDIEKRIKEHNQGIVKSTKNRRPLKLIHTEEFNTKKEAMKREKFYKSGIGREYLKKLFT